MEEFDEIVDTEGQDLAFKKPESLSKMVERYLEKEIIEGRLAPGLRLTPDVLAKRLNISKSPVREALTVLKKDGLVIFKPRIGFFVAEIRLEDIEEIYPIRASLNALAFKTIIEKGYDPEFISILEDTLQKMEKAVQQNDSQGFFYLNVEFYKFSLNCCPNVRLRKAVNQFGKQVLRFRYKSMSQPGHIKRSFERHHRLLEALKAKNVDATVHIAEEIIYSALATLRKTMKEQSD